MMKLYEHFMLYVWKYLKIIWFLEMQMTYICTVPECLTSTSVRNASQCVVEEVYISDIWEILYNLRESGSY